MAASLESDEIPVEEESPKDKLNPTIAIEDLLHRITLEEDEEEPLEVEDGDIDIVRTEAARHLGLIGRLVSDKQQNIKSMKIALSKAWGLKRTYQITDLHNNLFVFQFLDFDYRNKVCYGGPWNYGNCSIVFKASGMIQKPTPVDLHEIDIWIQLEAFQRN
ncbi:unnamed protein product [Linum trigynum]|uniref:DUF4283 domain-containing protein n=1 Tax=Linum trigynum TaxID=586398 RepID=A0AAV2E6I1_9ROSI